MSNPPHDRSPGTDLSIEDSSGEEVSPKRGEAEQGLIVAGEQHGHSLTLLEEFSMRRQRPSATELAFSLLCATASLAFAALIYFNTH